MWGEEKHKHLGGLSFSCSILRSFRNIIVRNTRDLLYLEIWRIAGLNFFVIKNIGNINGIDYLVSILQFEQLNAFSYSLRV